MFSWCIEKFTKFASTYQATWVVCCSDTSPGFRPDTPGLMGLEFCTWDPWLATDHVYLFSPEWLRRISLAGSHLLMMAFVGYRFSCFPPRVWSEHAYRFLEWMLTAASMWWGCTNQKLRGIYKWCVIFWWQPAWRKIC